MPVQPHTTATMDPTLSTTERLPNRVLTTAYSVEHAIRDRATSSISTNQQPRTATSRLPRPCHTRLSSSHNERPYDVDRFVKEASEKKEEEKTVLYLAYGSNLSSQKFRGDRGIRPLSQINVQVPSLRMTFDLPGIPYTEPCFANTARRDEEGEGRESGGSDGLDEKTALLDGSQRGKERGWDKGLIGVVYEVTAKDYAHIIATEGGGASYKDILVDCYPLPTDKPSDPVAQMPDTQSFRAHTLFAPAVPDGEQPPKHGGHFQRKPGYAQASARYLKLITDGAAECELPYEYQDYLLSLHSFTITNWRQRAGQVALLATWVPLVLLLFAMTRIFADKNGILPSWLGNLMGAVFKAVWASYDTFFKPMFGEGERTIDDKEDKHSSYETRGRRLRRRQRPETDIEKAIARMDRSR